MIGKQKQFLIRNPDIEDVYSDCMLNLYCEEYDFLQIILIINSSKFRYQVFLVISHKVW